MHVTAAPIPKDPAQRAELAEAARTAFRTHRDSSPYDMLDRQATREATARAAGMRVGESYRFRFVHHGSGVERDEGVRTITRVRDDRVDATEADGTKHTFTLVGVDWERIAVAVAAEPVTAAA